MSTRLSRFAQLFLMLFLLASAGRAQDAPASKLPSGVAPLPAKNAQHLEDLLHTAEKYRGLKALKPVSAGSLSVRSLKRQMTESLPRDSSPQELKALEVSLKAFGLIPEAMDLRRYLPELLSSQVAGFYDPDKKYLAMVDLPGGISGKGKEEGEEDMILIHELTHALQDQHFDLHRFGSHDLLSDAGTAGGALVEGDAMLTMLDANLKMSIEALPGTDVAMNALLQDPEKLMASTPDIPGAKEMAAAPAWIRDTLLFSYLQGSVFCLSTRHRGGQVLLDYAFKTDPPRSTEQILHPEKWHTRRDDPVALKFPDLAAELPGYRKAAEGEMGELSLRIFLRQELKSTDPAYAAAAGWGGDRFAVYEKAGARLVVWITEWDGEADAVEFRTALQGLGGWRVEAAGPSRVLAVRGALPDERWAGVRSRLAAVPAEKPANKDLDLKAIGAVPAEMDQASLEELKKNPDFQEGLQEGLKKAHEQEMPAGEVSGDGRVYTNSTLGFSIRVPEPLSGWTLSGEPPIKVFLMMISSEDEMVRVFATYQDLPVGLSLDATNEAIEIGLKAMIPGYNRLRRETVEKGDLRFHDTWFEMTMDDVKLNGVLRYLGKGSRAFILLAMGQAEPWAREQAAALQILDTFTLLAPKSGTPVAPGSPTPPAAPSPAGGR
jgi:hypothetical protein